ncbi:hypothetical protein KXW02_004832 [Aspergillus fumigatus]|nr:hypothetical protein KXW02_004832 [Aspergillus fumigatus]
MYPCLAFSHNRSSIRSTPSEASPTLINHVSTITDSFMGDGYFNSFDSEVPRAPPPSLDNDTLLDIHPRKTSFSDVLGMSSACAFPSWPKRPSLLSSDSEGSTASAYLSDEDLLFSSGPVSSSESAIEEESAAQEPAIGAHSLTTEQQIQMLRAAAEEEAHRARFLAQVQAHARAQQALRVAQMAATEKENTKSKKRRTFSDRKKRATFVRAIQLASSGLWCFGMSAASPLHRAIDSPIPRIAANDSFCLLSDAEWKAPAPDLSGKDEQSASLWDDRRENMHVHHPVSHPAPWLAGAGCADAGVRTSMADRACRDLLPKTGGLIT